MKWVFYLLLVANIAYFTWQTRYDESPIAAPVEVPDIPFPGHVDQLLLFHEVDPDRLQLRATPRVQHEESATTMPVMEPEAVVASGLETEPKPVVKPEPVASEPIVKQEPMSQPESVPEPIPESGPVAESIAKSEPKPTTPEPIVKQESMPQPESVPEPIPESGPVAESITKSEPKPTTPEPIVKQESIAESGLVAESIAKSEPKPTTSEPIVKQESMPQPESVPESIPESGPVAESVAESDSVVEPKPDTEPEPNTKAVAKTQADQDKPRVCRRLGPVPQGAKTNAIQTWFKTHDITMVSRVDEERKTPLHWVYLPPFENHIEAGEYVDRMKKDNIKDIYVLARGKMSHAISLGVFSKRDSMEKRVADLKEKGYSPSVGLRTRTQKITWFNVLSNADAFTEADFGKEFPSLEVAPIDCDNQKSTPSPDLQ
uniref:Sporulation related domain-containing protein n=1 Tax=Candidatus Kentrum sp. FW TaxID=2126338 RepID=A0A450SZ46_9GAMM|nr:MAG: hypothetical protein BECKFW1821A_GA0114235_108913 [Candidatus Kentron sp. FW]